MKPPLRLETCLGDFSAGTLAKVKGLQGGAAACWLLRSKPGVVVVKGLRIKSDESLLKGRRHREGSNIMH